MSYNSTTQYLKLPQWILSDPPQMSDFNTAFALIDAVGKYMHPVGSLYFSMESTNPGTLFGGTWTQIANGQVLVGVNSSDPDFNAAGKTGGEKEVTLNTTQMPAHYHAGSQYYVNAAGQGNKLDVANGSAYGIGWNFSYNTGTVGGGEAHNNMPPYLTCYIWQRTA